MFDDECARFQTGNVVALITLRGFWGPGYSPAQLRESFAFLATHRDLEHCRMSDSSETFDTSIEELQSTWPAEAAKPCIILRTRPPGSHGRESLVLRRFPGPTRIAQLQANALASAEEMMSIGG